MKFLLIFLFSYCVFVALCSKPNFINQNANLKLIWWRYNSKYNEAYAKMLQKKLEIEKMLQQKEKERKNEILIGKLISQAKSSILK